MMSKEKTISTEQALEKIKGIEILGWDNNNEFVQVLAEKDRIVEILKALRNDKVLKLNNLHCLSGVDYINYMEVVYHLYSYDTSHKVVVKARLIREDNKIESVASLWNVANYLERETYELYGIEFVNHPNLKRLLLNDDFPGFPFRKDYPLTNDEEWLLEDDHSPRDYGLPEKLDLAYYMQKNASKNGENTKDGKKASN